MNFILHCSENVYKMFALLKIGYKTHLCKIEWGCYKVNGEFGQQTKNIFFYFLAKNYFVVVIAIVREK